MECGKSQAGFHLVYLEATELWEGCRRLSGDCFGFIVLAVTSVGMFLTELMLGLVEPKRSFWRNSRRLVSGIDSPIQPFFILRHLFAPPRPQFWSAVSFTELILWQRQRLLPIPPLV